MEIRTFLAQSLLLAVALFPQFEHTTETSSKIHLKGLQYDTPTLIQKINTIRPPPL